VKNANLTLVLIVSAVLLASCRGREDATAADGQTTTDAAVAAGHNKKVEKEIFVGTATDRKKWPYRYFLVRDHGKWSGEIEYLSGDSSMFLDTMDVISSGDDKVKFRAAFGEIGRAFSMEWELSLSKSDKGFDGMLVGTEFSDGFKPIQLTFVASPDSPMPSSQVVGKVRELDNANYRTDDALAYEVALARKTWESESKIASRIAELRKDDDMRRGVRREWFGPSWVKERIEATESKYFERICCVYVGGTAVTDSDVQAICRLAELRELFLHSTGISDAALDNIGSLQGLRVLHLRDTAISDQGLEKLRSLSNIQHIYLYNTKISDAGGNRLRSQLPNAKIEW
jgi:hypothetical protein